MKTFYSAEDIENFADQGRRELSIGENVVLTDLARQTAQMLGIRITENPPNASPVAFSPDRSQPAGRSPALGCKPRGCQRRPAGVSEPTAGTAGRSRPVVDKLVEKIRRNNGT